MTLLERFLEDVRKRGGRGELVPAQSEGIDSNGSLAVPTTGITIRPRGDRASILIVNQDTANFGKAKLGGSALAASSGAGIRLDAAGGFVQFERDKDGEAVQQAVHLVADTAQITVYVYELEAD